MSGPGRRFDPAELAGATHAEPTDAEAAELLAVARELEDLARSEQIGTSVGFEDRVMAAVALAPRPGRRTAGFGGLAGLFHRIGLAWRDLWGAGRPLIVRTQALALLLVVALAAGSLGAVATVGVAGLLTPDVSPPPTVPVPSPSLVPSASVAPSPSPMPSPSSQPPTSPSPSPSPDPTPSETAEATESAEGTETAEPTGTDDDGGGSETARPTETSEPTDTAEPTDDSSGPGSGGDDGGGGPGSG